jgi:hypothetical protein
MRKRVILLALLFMSLSAAECSAGQKREYIYSMPIPKDFRIIAVAGAVHPKYPLYKADIDATGTVIYSQMPPEKRKEGLFVEVARFKLDEQALRAIFVAVRENDFFGLKKEYAARNVLDGTIAQLTVTENGKTHSVWTANTAVKRLDKIMIIINMALPQDRQVLYNEILHPKHR